MAGHSKWANIKHRKKRQDAKRGKIFTKIIRELTVAARQGGGDPGCNPRLRAAIGAANGANMPKDTVDRAIKRGSGGQDGANYSELRYEGYAPNGVAIMVDCLTDNKNRTVSEVRHAFSKYGGNLGTDGSVSYLFNEQGTVTFEPGSPLEQLMDLAIEAGAEDVVTHEDGSCDIISTPADFSSILDQLESAGLQPVNSELSQVASTYIELDVETARKVIKLIDALEDLDDVQKVSSNANFSAEVLEAMDEEG